MKHKSSKSSENQEPEIRLTSKKNEMVSYDSIKFRGAQSLEQNMKDFNEKLEAGNAYVEEQCQSEIEELKAAQEKFEKKLKKVMKSEKMQKLEGEMEDANARASSSMRSVQREFQRMHDEIEDSNLSISEKQTKLKALHGAALQQYNEVANKYPAALKAQMLSQISNVGLLM